MMIKKTLLGILVSLTIMAAAAPALAASWSNWRELKVFYIREMSGVSRLELHSTSNWGGGCNSTMVSRKKNDQVQNHYVSTALAAYLAGKRVKVYTDRNCSFTRMQVE